jgi:hypothetical protein
LDTAICIYSAHKSQLVRAWIFAPFLFSLIPYLPDRKRIATPSA